MFKSLSNKFQDTVQRLRGHKNISESNIESAISELRKVLLESDVSLAAVKSFLARVKEKALGADVVRGVKPADQFAKIVYDSLTELLSSGEQQLNIIENNPQAILLLGLQGAGKTSTAAKLAYKLKSQNKNPLLVPCDLQRPAAVSQLEILAKQADVDFFDIKSAGLLPENYVDLSPEEQKQTLSTLIREAHKAGQKNNNQTLIFDTAGRLEIDENLMQQLELVSQEIATLYIDLKKILVLDSLIGQQAANIATGFDQKLNIDGCLLTKLDSDSKGGAALSIVESLQKPIILAAIGEKLEDLETFYPDRIASRILGMGDVLTLVEKAEEKIAEEEAKKLEEQLMKGEFNYETFLAAQKMMRQLGNLKSMFSMMGMGSMLSQFGISGDQSEALLDESEKKFKKFDIIISSMTPQERRKPELIHQHSSARSRKERLARGSGFTSSDIDKLTAEFSKLKKTFAQITPMLNMMQAGGATPDPMQMLGAMAGGGKKKSKKGMPMMPGMPAMPGFAGAPKAKKSKTPKGAKPKMKGFKN